MASDEYRGTMYFSETLPKGSKEADSNFNPIVYEMVEKYLSNPKDYGPILGLQEVLLSSGYLDGNNPLSHDGNAGPMTTGAAERYQYNYANDALKHEIKQAPSKFVNYVIDSAKGIFD